MVSLSSSAWIRIGIPVGLYKLGFFAVIFLSSQLLPFLFNHGNFNVNFHWPPDAVPDALSIYKTWDGNHYLFLIEQGYRPGAMSNAFYPLWPLLVRLVVPLFGGKPLLCGIVLSNLFSIAAFVMFYSWVEKRFDARVALYALLGLMTYPGAMFFQFMYSESLFLFLLILFVVSLESSQKVGIMLTGLLLPLSRPVGILVLPYLAYRSYRLPASRLTKAVWLLSPCVGFAAYLLFMRWQTGDYFAGFAAQKSFVAQSALAELLNVRDFVNSLFNFGVWHGFFDSRLDRAFFIAFVVACAGLARLDPSLLLLAIPLGLIPALGVSFMAYSRYLAVVFPVFLFYGYVLARLSRFSPILTPVLLSLSFAIQMLFLVLFSNNYWVA